MEPAADFTATGISKRFGSQLVLDNLTLKVPEGMTLGLLGPNGGGKTTLLRILLGLLPADSGDARVAGEPSMDISPQLRGRIGYVPQSPAQFRWLTGKAMLSYVGAFYPTFDAEYAHALLDRWQVPLKMRIAAMSPGHQQRLSIVRALAPRPRLLVLDEPIASIDPGTRLAVIDELLAQQRDRKLTTIVSSHITGDLRRFCSHFAVLSRGGIVLHESTDALAERLRASSPGVEPDFDAALATWIP